MPATSCGARPCFLPYMNRTNPTPLVISEKKSTLGSNDMAALETSILAEPCMGSRPRRNRRSRRNGYEEVLGGRAEVRGGYPLEPHASPPQRVRAPRCAR